MLKTFPLGTIALLNKKSRKMIINKKNNIEIYEEMLALKMTSRCDSK